MTNILILVVSSLLLIVSPSFAGMTSKSYSIPSYVTDGGGSSEAGSSNYRLQDTIAQPGTIGTSESSNYKLEKGYIYTTQAPAPTAPPPPPPIVPTYYVPGRVLTYPTPFRPLKGDILRIGYALTDNSDIAIYIYSVSGEIVKTLRFRAGMNGGRAGDNIVEWNGVTDFGYVIGNGMYVYKIISRNKVVGSGKIVVYD